MKSFALACIAALAAAETVDGAKPTGITTSKASVTITLDAASATVKSEMGANFAGLAADIDTNHYVETMLCV